MAAAATLVEQAIDPAARARLIFDQLDKRGRALVAAIDGDALADIPGLDKVPDEFADDEATDEKQALSSGVSLLSI